MKNARDPADVVALKAVAWLASNEALLPVFLGSTGASEADMRTGLEDPDFQGSVLDFLLMDDAWIAAFCDAQGYDYDLPHRARMQLPGGAQVHWT